jgi:hypothetical protein
LSGGHDERREPRVARMSATRYREAPSVRSANALCPCRECVASILDDSRFADEMTQA